MAVLCGWGEDVGRGAMRLFRLRLQPGSTMYELQLPIVSGNGADSDSAVGIRRELTGEAEIGGPPLTPVL